MTIGDSKMKQITSCVYMLAYLIISINKQNETDNQPGLAMVSLDPRSPIRPPGS